MLDFIFCTMVKEVHNHVTHGQSWVKWITDPDPNDDPNNDPQRRSKMNDPTDPDPKPRSQTSIHLIPIPIHLRSNSIHLVRSRSQLDPENLIPFDPDPNLIPSKNPLFDPDPKLIQSCDSWSRKACTLCNHFNNGQCGSFLKVGSWVWIIFEIVSWKLLLNASFYFIWEKVAGNPFWWYLSLSSKNESLQTPFGGNILCSLIEENTTGKSLWWHRSLFNQRTKLEVLLGGNILHY